MIERLAVQSTSLAQTMALQSRGAWTFFRSVLRDPLSMGAVAPSSGQLSRLIASHADKGTSTILEVGPGTGSVTGALLERGINPERLFLIERDHALVSYLKIRFPAVRVACGDAAHAASILSSESVENVDTVLSSLPIRNLRPGQQLTTVGALVDVLAPGGQLLQYTYGSVCPIPTRTLGLQGECVGRVWANLPPAFLWRFTRKAQHLLCSDL